jgi:hypothetical protein
MIWVKDHSIHRTDQDTLLFVVKSHALRAKIEIHIIDIIAFRNGLVRANGLTGST